MGGAVESIVRKGKKILFFSYFSLSFFVGRVGVGVWHNGIPEREKRKV